MLFPPRRFSCLGLAAVLLALGCGDGEEGHYSFPHPQLADGDVLPMRGIIPADEREAPAGDLEWRVCPLVTGSEDEGAECATVSVPNQWEDPGGPELEIFVKRTRFVPRPRAQLWLLADGPGNSGAQFETRIANESALTSFPSFQEIAPDLEIYLLDHRGTGHSTRLGCEQAESPNGPGGAAITAEEWEGCRDEVVTTWGEELAGFTLTQAARDLGEMVQRTRHADEPVFIYGMGYGALWAERYLALFPEQPTGMVLDSPYAPGTLDYGRAYDTGFDRVARDLLASCADDEACSGVLGSDPWGTLEEVHAAIEAGDCPAAELTPGELRRVLAWMLTAWPFRDLIPAALDRIRSCDLDAIDALRETISIFESTTMDDLSSPVLFQYVAQSELVAEPVPSEAEASELVASLRVSPDIAPTIAHVRALGWPTAPRDPEFAQAAESELPLLIMNGDLSPETPADVALPLASTYSGSRQHFLTLPRAAYPVLRQSPIGLEPDDTIRTCGQELMREFLLDPNGELDLWCVHQVVDLDFADPELTALLFGDNTAWSSAADALSASPRGAAWTERLWRGLRSQR